MALNSAEAEHIRALTTSHNELMARVEHLEKVILYLHDLLPRFIKNRMKVDNVVPLSAKKSFPLNVSRIDSAPENIAVAWDTKIHGPQPGVIDRPIRALSLDMEENDEYG